jgi:alpha-glucosidase (family GH31 glycosyl hydrolase)
MNEPAMLYLIDKDIGEIVNDEFSNNSYFNAYADIPYIPGYRKGHTSLSLKSVSINAYSKKNNKKNNFYTMYNIKSLIPKIQVELTYNFLKYYHKRPFILSRGNTIGQGKHGFHWLGDNLSNFSHLKSSISGIFNYNIFGIPFTGADICGFHKNATDELCARWHVLGAFYPFSRNHNVDNAASQEPWVFDTVFRRYEIDMIDLKWPKEGYTLYAAKKAIKLKYSLLRYTYTQFFMISLGQKGAYFKPVFFEFPEDQILFDEMNVLNSHIMLGDSLYFIPNLNKLDSNYIGYFPNWNFNKFPEGNSFVDYEQGRNIGQFKELNGGYLDINIFLRGGKIIPYQNSDGVSSTNDLRNIRTSLIINPDHNKQASGFVIYDTDEIDSIEKKIYLHMKIEFDKDLLKFSIMNLGRKNNNFDEDIIEDIILYRASELNSNIFKTAEIYSYRDKLFRKKLVYYKEKDKLVIKKIEMPIYLLSNIYFEI